MERNDYLDSLANEIQQEAENVFNAHEEASYAELHIHDCGATYEKELVELGYALDRLIAAANRLKNEYSL